MIWIEINTVITTKWEFDTNESFESLNKRINLAKKWESKEVEWNPDAFFIETIIWERTWGWKLVKITEKVMIDLSDMDDRVLFIRNQTINEVIESEYDKMKAEYPKEFKKVKDALKPDFVAKFTNERKNKIISDIETDIKAEIEAENKKKILEELPKEIIAFRKEAEKKAELQREIMKTKKEIKKTRG